MDHIFYEEISHGLFQVLKLLNGPFILVKFYNLGFILLSIYICRSIQVILQGPIYRLHMFIEQVCI
jgi:hypothetical protein